MKKEIAELWVEALRGGKYVQGQGALQRLDGRFCCLGVLCDLAITHGVKVEVVKLPNEINYNGLEGVLPEPVVNWAGMQSVGGQLPDQPALWSQNDAGKSFKEIAAVIEANVDHL